jgi:hypothetical protein
MSVVLIRICSIILRIDAVFGIFILGVPHHKEESECEEVNKLDNADETEAHKQPTDASEVT